MKLSRKIIRLIYYLFTENHGNKELSKFQIYAFLQPHRSITGEYTQIKMHTWP